MKRICLHISCKYYTLNKYFTRVPVLNYLKTSFNEQSEKEWRNNSPICRIAGVAASGCCRGRYPSKLSPWYARVPCFPVPYVSPPPSLLPSPSHPSGWALTQPLVPSGVPTPHSQSQWANHVAGIYQLCGDKPENSRWNALQSTDQDQGLGCQNVSVVKFAAQM